MFGLEKVWNAVSSFTAAMSELTNTVRETNTRIREGLRLDTSDEREWIKVNPDG